MKPLAVGLTLAAGLVTSAEGQGIRLVRPDDTSGASAAVVVDGGLTLAYTTQFFPTDERGKVIGAGRAEEQAGAVLDRLEAALRPAGSGLDRLVRVHVSAAKTEVIPAFRAAFSQRTAGKARPAVSFVVGALARPEALFAVDAVAAAAPGSRARQDASLLPPGARVFVSGQADPGADLAQATRKTLEGLDTTLKYLGLDRSRVVQVKAFFRPMTSAGVVGREVATFFGAGAVPPTVLVEWRMDPPIEIELVAAAGGHEGAGTVEYLTPPALKPSPLFCRVVRVNRGPLIFTSGFYGLAGTTGADQVRAIFDALGGVIAEAGGDLRHLVKATYYVADDDASRALNELRPRYYDASRPPAASKATVAGVGSEGRSITLDMIAVPRP
jgi:enamine deaminase RidA (YjgF/YER057c/UK114 family)